MKENSKQRTKAYSNERTIFSVLGNKSPIDRDVRGTLGCNVQDDFGRRFRWARASATDGEPGIVILVGYRLSDAQEGGALGGR